MIRFNLKSKRSIFCFLTLLFMFISFSVYAQRITLTGNVKGADDNEPIPGATIMIKGQTVGSITDLDGNYTLPVQTGDVLIFSFVGMKTQEIEFIGQETLDVVLESDVVALGEVMVVAFGRQKKASVVGSIVQATSEEIMQAGSVSSVSQALAGILPGVSVMQVAGMPGATDANILIRGVSSWAGNTPLYLVDGVERDFNQIDPNEIASISVLKDASATAVYGVKAANGVILVTTKRGSDQGVRVNASVNIGVKVPTVKNDHATEYAEVLRYYNTAAMNDYNYSALITQKVIDAWADPNRDLDYYSYVFLSDLLIDKGYTKQYNVNASGGNERVAYFTSFGYHHDGDMFDIAEKKDFDPRTYQKRYNWRSNLDFNLTKSTKLGVNLSGDFRDWNGNKVTSEVPSGADASWTSKSFTDIFNTPQVGAPPLLSDGRLGFPTGAAGANTPYGKMTSEGQFLQRTTRVYSDIVLDQDITKHLKFTGKLSLNYTRLYNSNITLNEIYFEADPFIGEIRQIGDPDAYASIPRQSSESIGSYRQTLYYDLRLSYSRTFNENHDVHMLALVSRREDNQGLQFSRREESWVGRATYAFKSRYMFEFNGAYNGNENWAPGKKFGFFPSGAIGWNVSEEQFMKNNLPQINFFKIKYSYGIVGSDNGIGNDRFTYISSYDQMNNIYWGYGAAGRGDYLTYQEGVPANPNNTWEESVKQNLGFEFRFLKSRLKTEIDLYDEKRDGIIMQRRTIHVMMFGNEPPRANLGQTKTHGFDVSVNYIGNFTDDFSYYLNANLSMSENRVVFRDDLPKTPEYQKAYGKPIGYNTATVTTEFLQDWDDVYNSTVSGQSADIIIPGDYGVLDYNADGVINNEDLIPILNPSYGANSFAFSLGFEYKSFSILMRFNGVFNIAKTISNNYYYSLKEDGDVVNGHERDYWSIDNPDASSMSPRLSAGGYQYTRSDNLVRDSKYLRFRNLELKYTAGKGVKDKLVYFKNLEIYINGQNLLTWSGLPDSFDPESRTLISYPISRTYNIGCRASF